MNRIIYLFYYLKETDWREFWSFIKYVEKKNQLTKVSMISDVLKSSFEYNISLSDYFYFRFFEKGKDERETYAGTGFMYEFQKKVNPPGNREILHNKLLFFNSYSAFIRHKHCTLVDVENNTEAYRSVMASTRRRIVLKDAMGQCGWGVDVVDSAVERTDLLRHMNKKGYNLVEQYVDQHPDLAGLSSSGLNTVRIVTILDSENQVHFLGALLRISINSFVDNIAMGNIASPINLETGKIMSEGVYKDITKPLERVHPVTGKDLIGFQIPYWKEVMQMITKAALHNTGNRSIGWDIAITNEGPSLIEGNHNWCKLLWQLPYRKGLKAKILKYYNPGIK